MTHLPTEPGKVTLDITKGFILYSEADSQYEEASEGKAEGSFGRAKAATFSLGASQAGSHGAAFEVSHIAKYDAVHDKYTRARIMHSLNLQYGLW